MADLLMLGLGLQDHLVLGSLIRSPSFSAFQSSLWLPLVFFPGFVFISILSWERYREKVVCAIHRLFHEWKSCSWTFGGRKPLRLPIIEKYEFGQWLYFSRKYSILVHFYLL